MRTFHIKSTAAYGKQGPAANIEARTPHAAGAVQPRSVERHPVCPRRLERLNMDNMPKLTAEYLAGLRYAYLLWEQIEEANDRAADEGTDEWHSFEEAIQSAISAARRSKQED